ncbi:MAG: hypothetical protein AB1607_01305 [Chloroflexota bacterium]
MFFHKKLSASPSVKLRANRLSNSPSMLRQAQRDACRVDSLIRPHSDSTRASTGGAALRPDAPAEQETIHE